MKSFRVLSVIVIAALCVMALAGCSFNVGSSYSSYPDADKYSAGDAVITDTVDAVDIDYPTGKINVVTHADSTVTITEKTSLADIEDDLRVHWWLDGSTLRIKYCASNAGQGAFTFSVTPDLKKELTVELPEDITLSDFVIDASSADINAGGFAADKIAIDTSSGNIVFSQSAKADSVKLGASSGSVTAELGTVGTLGVNTSSGTIKVKQNGSCGSANFGASSGDITASLGSTGDVRAEASSGSVTLSAASASKAKVNTSSGKIGCAFGKTPDSLDIDASSGSVSLILPEDADFTAKIDTASGKVNVGFYALTDGEDTYTVGGGSAQISIGTSSGDVSVQPAK